MSVSEPWHPYADDSLAPDEARCALCGDVSPMDDLIRREVDEPGAWGHICQGCDEEGRLQSEP